MQNAYYEHIACFYDRMIDKFCLNRYSFAVVPVSRHKISKLFPNDQKSARLAKSENLFYWYVIFYILQQLVYVGSKRLWKLHANVNPVTIHPDILLKKPLLTRHSASHHKIILPFRLRNPRFGRRECKGMFETQSSNVPRVSLENGCKVRISEHNTKKKNIFLLLSSKSTFNRVKGTTFFSFTTRFTEKYSLFAEQIWFIYRK